MPASTARTSFIGRRSELATLRRLLGSTRLLTMVGAGGCGKTRLAMELARTAKRQRVAWVDLAPLRDERQIPLVVGQAVGGLDDEPVLLVLDNCEHVIVAVASLAGALLNHPALTILATSRQPLRVDGELLWHVPGLSLPQAGSADDPRHYVRCDAVQFFTDRARLVQQDFTFDATNSAPVVAVCRRLDGMPLALELAAARLRHFDIGTIETLLARPLELLSGQDGNPEPRHRTIRATIDWSYELLFENDRRLLRRLAVFAGGFTLDAAAAVLVDETATGADVAEPVSRLVDQSLVEFDRMTLRYRLLEPVREYALEQLISAGEEGTTVDRLTAWLDNLFDRELPLVGPPRDAISESRVRTEFFNLAAVLPRLMPSHAGRALALVLRFARFPWTMVPIHVGVVEDWLRAALANHTAPDRTRALGLLAQARILGDGNRLEDAREAAAGAVAIADSLGDSTLLASARFGVAYVCVANGDLAAGEQLLDDAIPVLQGGDAFMLTRALNLRAILRARSGDHRGAESDVELALRAWARAGETALAVRFQSHLIGADVAYRRGDSELALKRLRDAIESQRAASSSWAGAIDLLAHLLATRGDLISSMTLAGYADRQLGERGLWPDRNFALADRGWLADVEQQLGEPGRRLRAEGRAMEIERVYDIVFGERRSPLTKREGAIASLVSEGLSDREIAARLVISERTVENHVRHVREKLSLRSRSQIGRWLAEQP